MRIGLRDEIHVAGAEIVGLDLCSGAEDCHAGFAAFDITHFRGLWMPMRFTHPVALNAHGIHGEAFQRRPELFAGGAYGAEFIGDCRSHAFQGQFVMIGESGLPWDFRPAGCRADEDVFRRIPHILGSCFRKIPGVAHDVGVHAADGAGHAEVFGVVV